MPINLTDPPQSIALPIGRVVAIKIENNPFTASYWIDVFIAFGHEIDGAWRQHVDAQGAIAQYFRIAPGQNPTARPAFQGSDPASDGPPLGKCDVCGVWHVTATGPCTEDGCSGTVQPYDGMQRMCLIPPSGSCNYDSIKHAIYSFLTTEEVPDPVTGEIKVLLAGTETG